MYKKVKVHWPGSHPSMPIMASVLVTFFVLFTIVNGGLANELYLGIKVWIESKLGWFYILFVNIALLFCLWPLMGRVGNIRLGGKDAKPDFSRFTWFSMLFSASIGIGLMFWSIAEPIYHFQDNPFMELEGVTSNTMGAAQLGLRLTFFHWGVHGWAIFALTGLSLAYFSYNKGLPLAIRSTLYPLLGERIYGPFGNSVDLLAVFGTVFGVATSFGLGVSQMNTGFSYLFDIEISVFNQVLIIASVTTIATLSTASGVEKGMRFISEWNIKLSAVLLVFFLITGPTLFLLDLYKSSVGDYLAHVIQLGFWIDPRESPNWQGAWTIFYWGWWISWSPFVGIFIARISRGRTIREFLVGVIIVPCFLTFFWICVFGGTGIHMEIFGEGGIEDVINTDLTMALYRTIELLNVDQLTWIVSALATFLILTWFVTSADSGTLVVCTLLSMGDRHPTQRSRVFWGISIGLVAAALLLAGGLEALKSVSTIVALPFSMVLLLMAVSLAKSLKKDEL
ncbi:BCCT family transporter [Pseudomaricurvus alkylphenolicus]|uniref:BCCT family transporter n=1 Tax=Pseudomaricurvus alkylphenolicus TaxID=1306991 RepID=UPI001981E39C|nr:BCCT family transporter [Pseudomaricurvus alkylphenolicus]